MSGSVCTSFIISPKAQEAYARITTLLLLVQVHLMSVCVSMLKKLSPACPYDGLLCLPKGAKPLEPRDSSSPNRPGPSVEKGSKRGSRESRDPASEPSE